MYKKIIMLSLLIVLTLATHTLGKDVSWKELQSRGQYYLDREDYAQAVQYFKDATIVGRLKYGLVSAEVLVSLISQSKCHYALESYEEAAAAAALSEALVNKLPSKKPYIWLVQTKLLYSQAQRERGYYQEAIIAGREAFNLMVEHIKYYEEKEPSTLIHGMRALAALLQENGDPADLDQIIRLKVLAEVAVERDKRRAK